MELRQIRPREYWPSGDSRPMAVLPFEPADMTERFGLRYQPGIDDLDHYVMAAIELANGEQAWVSKYDHDLNPGTMVYVDAGASIEEAQILVAEAFGLEREELLWLAPVTSHDPVSSLG